MSVLDSLLSFESSEPQMCIWCHHCGTVLTDGVWGHVCTLRAAYAPKRGRIEPLPAGHDNRVSAQCVQGREAHPCFSPTPVGSGRMRLLDAMGLLPSDGDSALAPCPWCGHAPRVVEDVRAEGRGRKRTEVTWHSVRCTHDGCPVHPATAWYRDVIDHPGRARAMTEWNKIRR